MEKKEGEKERESYTTAEREKERRNEWKMGVSTRCIRAVGGSLKRSCWLAGCVQHGDIATSNVIHADRRPEWNLTRELKYFSRDTSHHKCLGISSQTLKTVRRRKTKSGSGRKEVTRGLWKRTQSQEKGAGERCQGILGIVTEEVDWAFD